MTKNEDSIKRPIIGNVANEYKYAKQCVNNGQSKEAEIYFTKAALKGHVESMYELAMLYADNENIVYDENLFKEWITKARKKGHKKAQAEWERYCKGSNATHKNMNTIQALANSLNKIANKINRAISTKGQSIWIKVMCVGVILIPISLAGLGYAMWKEGFNFTTEHKTVVKVDKTIVASDTILESVGLNKNFVIIPDELRQEDLTEKDLASIKCVESVMDDGRYLLRPECGKVLTELTSRNQVGREAYMRELNRLERITYIEEGENETTELTETEQQEYDEYKQDLE